VDIGAPGSAILSTSPFTFAVDEPFETPLAGRWTQYPTGAQLQWGVYPTSDGSKALGLPTGQNVPPNVASAIVGPSVNLATCVEPVWEMDVNSTFSNGAFDVQTVELEPHASRCGETAVLRVLDARRLDAELTVALGVDAEVGVSNRRIDDGCVGAVVDQEPRVAGRLDAAALEHDECVLRVRVNAAARAANGAALELEVEALVVDALQRLAALFGAGDDREPADERVLLLTDDGRAFARLDGDLAIGHELDGEANLDRLSVVPAPHHDARAGIALHHCRHRCVDAAEYAFAAGVVASSAVDEELRQLFHGGRNVTGEIDLPREAATMRVVSINRLVPWKGRL
jgi:hypothetical protein